MDDNVEKPLIKVSRLIKPYEKQVKPSKKSNETIHSMNNVQNNGNEANKELGFITLPKHLLEKLNESTLIFKAHAEIRDFYHF